MKKVTNLVQNLAKITFFFVCTKMLVECFILRLNRFSKKSIFTYKTLCYTITLGHFWVILRIQLSAPKPSSKYTTVKCFHKIMLYFQSYSVTFCQKPWDVCGRSIKIRLNYFLRHYKRYLDQKCCKLVQFVLFCVKITFLKNIFFNYYALLLFTV